MPSGGGHIINAHQQARWPRKPPISLAEGHRRTSRPQHGARGSRQQDGEDRAVKRPTKPRAANRGSLPKHLARIEEIIEPDGLTCACGGCLHCIGEDVSERLDIGPAQFRVTVTRRPKYACRSCTDGVAQASAPPRLIPGGMPTEATVAHVLGQQIRRSSVEVRT